MRHARGWVVALALMGCARGAEPIRWGLDTCARCQMVLEDRRFVAEWVGPKVAKFDGIDELAAYLAEHPSQGHAWVGDGDSGRLIEAEGAVILVSPDLHGPMGGHLMSFATREAAERYARAHRLGHVRLIGFAQAMRELKAR